MGRGTWWATDHGFAESLSTHKIMIKSVNLLILKKNVLIHLFLTHNNAIKLLETQDNILWANVYILR